LTPETASETVKKCREVISGTRLESVSYVGDSVKTGLEPGERGIAIVGDVSRKHLLTD
jgi:hypothetical protein